MWKSAADLLRSASDSAGEAVKEAKEKYEQSLLKAKLDQAAEQTQKVLDETGISEFAGRVSKSANEQLDSVSGAKMLALVEERLQIQDHYNDILATKLQEALDRIEELEKQLLLRGSK
jgi:predicted  nucleic acid-binding Zn-ribbon protein